MSTTEAHHGHASGAADGEPILEHHFDDLEQQHESSMLGMWLFLATEVMFFGGLFTGYTIYRMRYPEAFAAASRHLSVPLGGFNTAVLLCSSLSMAFAVRASQLREHGKAAVLLVATMGFGAAFLGIKAVEYYTEYTEHLIPGLNWDWALAQSKHESSGGEGASSHGAAHEPEDIPAGKPAGATDVQEEPAVPPSEKAKMFFVLYFMMTGLHAIHLIIGIVLVGLVAALTWRRWFSGGGATQIEVTGLYWHFIDIVWVFLYPLLYLIDVRQ
jgi:cytochrome c oxidase subunit III